MNRDIQKKVGRITKEHKTRKRALWISLSLCAVVALGVTYALINPASTQHADTYCGFEEHVHTDECYERALICQLYEEGHEHSDACYEDIKELSCTLKESEGHTHTDACLGEERILVCNLQETEGHVHSEECYLTEHVLICENSDPEHEHTDECFEDRQTLVCGLTECEPHQHTEECYKTEQIYICGLEECEPHQHTEECYTTERVLTCELRECEPHQHTEACYAPDYENLVCELEVHEHTLQCFSNPEADLEDASVWERSFNKAKLSGVWNEDVLAIAETQLGYTESSANYMVQEDGVSTKGYTRYGAWYGDPYGDWCAMFCSFCINYAGVDRELMPMESGCTRWVDTLNGLNLYHPAEGYTPAPGDLIFFDMDPFDPEHPENRQADHVGLVSELIYKNKKSDEIEKIRTIEGNNGESVARFEYLPNDTTILGYGHMVTNPRLLNVEAASVPECDCGVNNPEHLDWHSDSCARKSYTRELCDSHTAAELAELFKALPEDVKSFALTYLSWGQNAKLDELKALLAAIPVEKAASDGEVSAIITGSFPENAVAELQKLDESNNEIVESYIENILGDIGGSEFSGAIDLGLYENGEKLDLEGNSVTVSVGGFGFLAEDIEWLIVNAYHLKNTDADDLAALGEKVPEIERIPASIDENGNIVFETSGFSVIYFTVDFHYSGSEYSLKGEESILLGDLFAELGLSYDPTLVESVEFSDPSLLTVLTLLDEDGVTVTDWALVSLEPFTSDETLRITMSNGRVIEIDVTDAQTLTSVSNGDQVIIQVNQNTKYYLTATSSDNKLKLTTKESEATVWTVSVEDGKTYLKFGNNYLTVGKETAGTSSSNKASLAYQNGGYWQISQRIGGNKSGTTYYLNQFGGSNATLAGGYNVGAANDSGSRWNVLAKDSGGTNNNGTIKSGNGGSATYTVKIYGYEVNEDGNPTKAGSSAVLLGTVTLNSSTTSTTALVPSTLFSNYAASNSALSGKSYVSAYYGTASTIDKDGINSLYRSGDNSNRYVGISYLENGQMQNNAQYITNSDPKALYIRYTPTAGGGEIVIPPVTPKEPDHKKYIDAFRDGADNSDTDLDNKARNGQLSADDDIFDLYRQYLDVGPESAYDALDILFILDSSSSMCGDYKSYGTGADGFDAKDIYGNQNWRAWALDTLLNGQSTDVAVPNKNTTDYCKVGATDAVHQQVLYSNGLISKIAALNPNNKLAVARFSGTSQVLLNWTKAGEIKKAVTYSNGSGTNYVAGLQEARKFLNAVKGDGNKKIMIFLSDGRPTKYYESLDSSDLKGSGSEGETEFNKTLTVINAFKDLYSNQIASGDLEIYTIGVGTWDTTLLQELSTTGTSFNSTNFARILKLIDSKITHTYGHYSDLKVTDTLSEYVDFYTGDLDFKVEKVPVDNNNNEVGDHIPLYENGELTVAGAECIKTNGVSIDYKNKIVSVDFKDTYKEEGGFIYRISFNIKTKQHAYDTFAENLEDGESGYDATGNLTTDYPNNETSQGKPGFHSNSSAVLEYAQALDGETVDPVTADYYHPVIQVRTYDLKISKTWSDGADKHSSDSVTVDVYKKALPATGFDPSAEITAEDIAGGTKIIENVVLNAANNWTYSVEGLPRGYYYYIIEQAGTANYLQSYSPLAVAVPHNAKGDLEFDLSVVNTKVEKNLVLIKTDMGTTPRPLKGAEFKLYSDSTHATEVYANKLIRSGNDGVFTPEDFMLDNGTYYLVETKAPDGYNLLPDDVVLVVTDDGITASLGGTPVKVTSETSTDGGTITYTISFADSSGYELPETGGIGTTPYILCGLLLTAGAVYGYALRRKKERRSM